MPRPEPLGLKLDVTPPGVKENSMPPTITLPKVADLVIQSVTISYYLKPWTQGNNPPGGNNFDVTVKNTGNGKAQPSSTVLVILRPDSGPDSVELLDSQYTDTIPEGKTTIVHFGKTPAMTPGSMVICVANAPVPPGKIGAVNEYNYMSLGTQVPQLNNAFAVPYPEHPPASKPYIYYNPGVK